MRRGFIFVLAALTFVNSVQAASYYTEKPNDPNVVVLTKDQFPDLHADGNGDDTATLQTAILQANDNGKVLLVPQGRYVISKTVGIPPSTRVIGFGKQRPVFVLLPHTSGYDTNPPQYMIWFSGGQGRRNNPTTGFPDASPGTFYSGISNIDFEIGDGNPAAVAIRSHFAQHGIVAHIDFNIGSGYAGIDGVGNEAEDLHFHGGEYGIVASGTSPSWQYTLLDSTFDGQRTAAFKTHSTGLTLLRDEFKNMPTAVKIDDDQDERLYMKNCRLENISRAALVIGDEDNVRNHINLKDIFCQNVRQFALYHKSGKQVPGGGEIYRVKNFNYGLQIADLGEPPIITQTYATEKLDALPEPVVSDICDLPPMHSWLNIMDFGAEGDGKTDDGPAFEAAMAKAKPIFLPRGRYRVTDTIHLRPDIILIGLNPITTQIGIDDNEPKFMGDGDYKAVIEAPHGGENILTGIGIDTSANNTRAVGLKWMAGPDSMVNDVKFIGGHGSSRPDSRISSVYNRDHSGDADPNRKWNTEGPSLLVTDGGSGAFIDIWTANTFANAGMMVQNTSVPGNIYELSSEHHVSNEVIFHNVSNWSIYAEQTEEEWGEGPKCLPLEVDHCSNLTFANTILFRVFAMSVPAAYGAKITDSSNIRFLGMRTYGQSPFNFDNPIYDATANVAVRSRELGYLNISGKTPKFAKTNSSRMKKLEGTFISADHAVADADGNAYFVDMQQNKVFKLSADDGKLSVLRDDPIAPFALAIDHSGNLIILSHQGKVYSLPLKDPHAALTELTSSPATTQPSMSAFLASDRWWDNGQFIESNARREPLQFVSADKSVFIPVPEDYSTGRQHNWTSQPINLYRSYQLAQVEPGKPFYVADENEHKTWMFTANADGTLSNPKFFAQHGEAGVITDAKGNVYIAEGDIFVYDSSGRQIDLIRVPDRPLSMVFCGKDRQTLLIAARGGVYTLRMNVKGS